MSIMDVGKPGINDIIESIPWTDDMFTTVFLRDILYWEMADYKTERYYCPVSITGTRIVGKWTAEHYATWLEFKIITDAKER